MCVSQHEGILCEVKTRDSIPASGAYCMWVRCKECLEGLYQIGKL